MAKTIAVINQKGGVGKSTTAANFAAGLTLKGYKVLAVDLDAQRNLSYVMGCNSAEKTTYTVLAGKDKAAAAIIRTETADLMPGDESLAAADILINKVGKEYKLKEALQDLAAGYDYIVLDTPPALGILTVNALAAADSVLIPAQADLFSLQGIGQLWETIQGVKQYCNPALAISGIVLTRYSSRAVLNRQIAEMLNRQAAQMGAALYDAKIRETVTIKEAQVKQKSIYAYDSKSKAAADYMALVDEYLERSK